MAKRLSFLIFVLIILLVVFQKPLVSYTKALLFISQELPQIKIKPLHFITREPEHEKIEFQNLAGNKVIADVFGDKGPAIILTMGVKTAPKDKPLILDFADTMARLGYIVMWPRLEVLEAGKSRFEDPETFITSFEYLANTKRSQRVNKPRISFIGFSVGSSVAMVAAENPLISGKVNSFVFFGGYYDIFEYLKALKNGTDWQPAEGAVHHVGEIVSETGIDLEEDKEILDRFNPSKNIKNFKAKIFILHERGDTYVPYTQSEKLNQALLEIGKKPEAFHIANLFEHVKPSPGAGLTTQTIQELLRLYLFVVKALESF